MGLRAGALLSLLIAMVGIGPLGDRPMEQAQTADDFTARFDAAPLYPLLNDALTWKAGDESGARIPDYSAILAAPPPHRAQVFLIEGELVRAVKAGKLARAGPWDDKLVQWVIKHGPAADDTVLVYLADPPAEAQLQQRVRLPARFYKVWRSKVEGADEQADFLVFIGNTAQLQERLSGGISGGISGGGGGNVLGALAMLIAALIVMAIIFIAMRIRWKARPIEQRRLGSVDAQARGASNAAADESEQTSRPPPPLPSNPADAMDELRRQHED